MIKQNIIALGLLIMLVCSTLTVTAGITGPTVRFPPGPLRMRATDGANSWFDIYLFNIPPIPPGFDIMTGTYKGWCVQTDTAMARNVNHSVLLYSSYDPNIPLNFIHKNWDKVNYLINHDEQGDRESIQSVIWYYICGNPYPRNDTQARAMINDTNVSGPGFVPQPGQKIAILVNVTDGNEVQRAFIELPLRSAVELGDLVWNDYNANGIQDAIEPGIQGVTVQLYYNASNMSIKTTTTDISGYYLFSGLVSGNYSIQFVLPQGYNRFSPQQIGSDVTKDNDANSIGRTPTIVVNQLQNDTTWDAGIYLYSEEGGAPTPTPSNPSNIVPTSDGTAGEPYNALIGQEIKFNGSRSYDPDGTIVSWHWSFGDGTTANGAIVTHNYTNAGNYTVMLTVTDNDNATDAYTTVARIKLPNRPPLPPTLTGPAEGNRNISYVFNVATTDPDYDNVRYVILWGDGLQNTSLFFSNGHKMQTTHQWSAWGFYTIQAYAQDTSNVTSDVSEIMIAIDVQYVGNLGYLINTDSVGPFDTFYSNLTQSQTSAQQQQTGVYLIDTNGDGKNDYQYDPSSATTRAYPETLSPSYTMLLVGVGVAILVLLLLGFLTKRKWKKPKQ